MHSFSFELFGFVSDYFTDKSDLQWINQSKQHRLHIADVVHIFSPEDSELWLIPQNNSENVVFCISSVR